MKISQKGIQHIKDWEKLRLKAYRPLPHDRWTIGWGHTHTVTEGMTITEDEAEHLLLNYDIPRFERCLNRNVRVSLEQHEVDALMSFIFNVGCDAFVRSDLLEELNAGHYDRVPDQLKRWKYSNGKEVKGLIRRRNSEIAMWHEPEDDVVAANSRPQIPKGRSIGELAKTSKTVQATAVGAVGTASQINLELDEIVSAQEKLSTITSSLQENMLPVGLMIVFGFLIWNRYRDSKKGKAY